MRYLLDTNVVSEVMKATPDPDVETWIEKHDEDCALSVITIAEIANGIVALPDGKKKAALSRNLDFLRQDYADQTLVFDEACAWEWARYCQEARLAGREPPILDSQLAATARSWGLTVVTRNEDDFPLMEVINPFKS